MRETDLSATVFFVTRIGGELSDERRRSDDIMEFLLRPAVFELDPKMCVVRADELAAHARITDKIVEHILRCAVTVADATGLNPNVFYELGIAHARHRPVVLLIDDPTSIPFDTRAEAHLILPGNTELGARTVRDKKPLLMAALREAINSSVPPGPVASAEAMLVQPDISPSDATSLLRSSVSELTDRLDALESIITSPRRRQRPRAEHNLEELDETLIAYETQQALSPGQFVDSFKHLILHYGLAGSYTVSSDRRGGVVIKRLGSKGPGNQFTLNFRDGDSMVRNLGTWLGLEDSQIRQMVSVFDYLKTTM